MLSKYFFYVKKTLALLAIAASVTAHAWEPTKPVTVIVGNTPGAGNEIAFRKLAEIVQRKNPNFVYVVQNIFNRTRRRLHHQLALTHEQLCDQ
jgi:tripartite-type tricarboxylate transporter receptor subunit TctC